MKSLLMTPEQFKTEVQERGWTYRMLSRRWGISESYLSRLSRDPDRGTHWDDAVRGLPVLRFEAAPKSESPST